MLKERMLEGKVAVVTGAGRGIGRAIAMAYAGAGASVVCAARTQSEIDAVAAEVESAGGRAAAIQTDVTSQESIAELFKRVKSLFGGLDILVINAGINTDRNTVENSDPQNWRKTIEVNLFGAYNCAYEAIPYLKERGSGKIITIGSGLGHHGSSGGSAYSCSKAGLWMLTRVLAQELWQDRISVNELIPGPVATTIDDGYQSGKNSVDSIDSEWVKRPEDVVPLALFLASQPDIGPTAQSFSLMRRDG